jgi:methionyl-tRNA formyltransferase
MTSSQPLNILLCCATKKGHEVLQSITSKFPKVLGAVTTFRETNMKESYYEPIIELSKSFNIPVIDWNSFKKNPENIIKTHQINCIITISWKYFIPVHINQHLEHKIIIMHDSILPKYRGFAPVPTAIINGENELGVSVLYASDKIDEGPIISQKTITISEDEYVRDVIDRITGLYTILVVELLEKILSGDNITATPQDHSKATYSIWRNPEDSQINWDASSKEIYNLIRAVGYPYSGAFSYLGDRKVHIWRSEIVIPDITFEVRESGKIWQLDIDGKPTVVCRQGLLKITEATLEDRSIFPLKKLRQSFHFRN